MQDDPFPILERISQLLRAEQADLARRHGLRAVHAAILRFLARANGLSNGPAAVAEYLGLTSGTVSVSMGHLEKRGLVRGEPTPEDARRVGYRLTDEGRAFTRKLDEAPRLRAALVRLGSESGMELATLLAHLLSDLQGINGGRAFGLCRECRHFLPAKSGAGRCGLTGAALTVEDGRLICRHWSRSEPEPARQPAMALPGLTPARAAPAPAARRSARARSRSRPAG